MSHINFVIPQSPQDLLRESYDIYYVKDVVPIRELPSKISAAKSVYKDDGPEYIIDTFDTYYSLIHHSNALQLDIIYTGYEHLHKAVKDLDKSVNFILEDQDSLNDELKAKYQTIVKMLLYIYINIVNTIEQKNEIKHNSSITLKGKGRKKAVEREIGFYCNKKEVLIHLGNIVQKDIKLFWDPPVLDEVFINMVSDIAYIFLESDTIKNDKELLEELFGLLGLLIKNNNHGHNFVERLVRLLKMYDHLVNCIPEGIKQIIETFSGKSIFRDLIREITEWQTDEQYVDNQGTKNCAIVLTAMATLMPQLMMKEVEYLNRYLAHDSYALRNSVLTVMSEVILAVLTSEDLTEEEKEYRDDMLNILQNHMRDTSCHVRSKAMQHWTRLQKENAVPLSLQTQILSILVFHLRDKASSVRKSAATAVITFIEHNIYGSNLKKSELEKELKEKEDLLNTLNAELEGCRLEKQKQAEEEWKKIEEDIKKVIEAKAAEGLPPLENDDDGEEVDVEEGNKDETPMLLRIYIQSGKYEEAFEICRTQAEKSNIFKMAREEFKSIGDNVVNVYLLLMRNLYMNIDSELEGGSDQGPSAEDLTRLTGLKRTVEFLQDTVKFLEIIDDAMHKMKELLGSATLADTLIAIEFYVVCYKFKIDKAGDGILALLKLINSDQPRREAVLNALKTIYLTTDSKTLNEHTKIIVDRLIDLIFTVPYENFDDIKLIISEWVSKGVLDNSIIDALWQYFTKKAPVSNDESRAALTILTMASEGRRSIIKKNIKLVVTVAFGERGLNDVLLLSQACRILAVAGLEPQNITDENPPFRIDVKDEMWQQLGDILVSLFDKRVKFYNVLLSAAIHCIYSLSSNPPNICSAIIKTVVNKMVDSVVDGKTENYLLIRCTTLLGEIALRHLNYLDHVVYKEVKRRQHFKGEKKTKKKTQGRSKGALASNMNKSLNSTINNLDESVMEGAQATDTDADFICNILDVKTVTGPSSWLGPLADHIITITKQSEIYDDEHLQCAAVTALLRFMLVSSQFCEENIQLVFTILHRSQYDEVKNNILIHIADLLARFPNTVEPYTHRIYMKLQGESMKIRRTTYFLLANMILKDMMRMELAHVWKLAQCVIDEDETMIKLAKNFFSQLSQKICNFYNILPDIFSHLVDNKMPDDDLQDIMRYMFSLIKKPAHMESLVERFCVKFRTTEDENVCCNIAFCLSLIEYSEKGIRKLIDNYEIYKHLIFNDNFYATFRDIISISSKGPGKGTLKTVLEELQEKLKSSFDTNENGSSSPQQKKLVKQVSKSRPKKRGRHD